MGSLCFRMNANTLRALLPFAPLLGLVAATPLMAATLADLQARAAKGEALAQYELAEAHYWGHHNATMDHNASLHWAGKAAAQKHGQGMYRLGVMRVLGHGDDARLKEGVQLLSQAMPLLEKGGVESRFQHALLLISGLSTEANTTYAARSIRAAAEAGLAEAQFRMGLYHMGVGDKTTRRERKPLEARDWWGKAAAQGHALAQYHLGDLHADGRYLPRNNATALDWYRKSAQAGLAQAQHRLGALQLRGWGAPADAKAGAAWIIKAAEQGDAGAQHELGIICYAGTGREKNLGDAFFWLSLAGQQGSAEARTAAGVLGEKLTSDQLFAATKRLRQFQPQPTAITQRYRLGLEFAHPQLLRVLNFEYASQRADQGDLNAKRLLVDFYFSGLAIGGEKLVDRDGVKVVGMVRELAEKGDTFGMWNLAVMYNQGVVQTQRNPKDPSKFEEVTLLGRDLNASALWLSRAVLKGNTRSMVALAIAYEKGEGVDRNRTAAWQHYNKAAELGDPDAMYGIARAIGDKWEQAPSDPARRIEWLLKAAQRGNVHSQYELYEAAWEGKSDPKELVKAKDWLERAAKQGFAPAQWKLGTMHAEGTVGGKDKVQALKWLYLAANANMAGAAQEFKALQPTLTAEDLNQVRRLVEDFVPLAERDPDAASAGAEDPKALLAAAKQGQEEAQLKLARRLSQGVGGPIDRPQAYQWFSLAAEQGSAQASGELGELIPKMSAEELLEGRRLLREARAKKNQP